jgi:hypothetical protein
MPSRFRPVPARNSPCAGRRRGPAAEPAPSRPARTRGRALRCAILRRAKGARTNTGMRRHSCSSSELSPSLLLLATRSGRSESLSGAVDETGGCAARRDVAAFLFASLVRPPPLARLGASAGSARLCASMAEALSGAVDERGGCAAPRDVAAFLFASLACPPPLPRPEPRPIVRSSRFSKFRTLALQLLAGLAGWFSRHWATARPARLASRRLPAAVCIAAGPAPALPLQRAAKPFDANRPPLIYPLRGF